MQARLGFGGVKCGGATRKVHKNISPIPILIHSTREILRVFPKRKASPLRLNADVKSICAMQTHRTILYRQNEKHCYAPINSKIPSSVGKNLSNNQR